jgi:hypothetical protein
VRGQKSQNCSSLGDETLVFIKQGKGKRPWKNTHAKQAFVARYSHMKIFVIEREFRRIPDRELLDYDGNPRRHPQAHRDAPLGVLEEIGVAGAMIAFYSERNSGKLSLIDGRLRKQDFDLAWLTLILAVTDA